jgi:hypothetical protein
VSLPNDSEKIGNQRIEKAKELLRQRRYGPLSSVDIGSDEHKLVSEIESSYKFGDFDNYTLNRDYSS